MGRQINFFMMGSDEEQFIDTINANGDCVIDRFGNVLTKDNILHETWGQVFINFPQSRLIKLKNHNLIDDQKSDVIEFDRSEMRGKIIASGRIYIDLIDYDESGNKIRRGKWLEDKYNYYKKWIVRRCKISKNKGWYIGKETYRLYKEMGYKMVDHFGSKDDLRQGIDFD